MLLRVLNKDSQEIKMNPLKIAIFSNSMEYKSPSCRVRDRYKRRRVIAIEMEVIRKSFDPDKFVRLGVDHGKCFCKRGGQASSEVFT